VSDHSDSSRRLALVRARIPKEKKQQFAALAKKRGITETKLLRQLIAQALADSTPSLAPAVRTASLEPARGKDRLLVRLHPADRRALQELAAARNVTSSRYVTALIRAHLNTDPRLPAAEAAMLKDLVKELNAVGASLNHLVHAANGGVVWAEAFKEVLEEILKIMDKIALRLREFARTNRRSWEAKVAPEDLDTDSPPRRAARPPTAAVVRDSE
jgi:predicted DNA-binding protein